ncbi:MAG: hypothetical protein ACHQEM_04475 [Chitinophagales bacterium]
MLNPSDKELDRLSREAAEHFEPDEMISSWEQIVPRLDREIGVRPNTSFRYFGRGPLAYGVILLSLAGISYFFLKQKQADDLTKSNKISISSEKGAINQKLEKSNVVAGNTDQRQKDLNNKPSAQSETPGSEVDADATHIPLLGKPAPGKEANTATANLSRQPSDNQHGSALTTNVVSETKGRKNNTIGNSHGHAAMLTLVPAGASMEKPAGNREANGNSYFNTQSDITSPASKQNAGAGRDPMMAPISGILPMKDQNVSVSDASLRNQSSATVQLSAAAITQSKNTQRVLRMSRALKIGLLYGSDVTSVHSVAPDKLSNNFGLTIGYQFFDHLSINTGAIYTKKNYSANEQDFNPPPSPASLYGRDFEYASGNCNMWEIPLTIRYDFDRIGNTTLFVNGGASTYVMMHENYVFYSHYFNSGGVLVPWHTEAVQYNTNETYLFAVIDFSLGVEQKISKSFSFQIEPFFKIPVKGVGYGNLDLSSFGANLSLRYSPLLKSSRK